MVDQKTAKICGPIFPEELEALAKEASKIVDGVIVELGSYFGKSTCTLAEWCRGTTKVHAVDMWDNRNMGKEMKADTFAEFSKNIEPWKDRIHPIREDTVAAAKNFKGPVIDLLFIDANHSYTACLADLEAWYPLVKVGGTIMLHDYTQPMAGVKRAAQFYFRSHRPRTMSLACGILVVKK